MPRGIPKRKTGTRSRTGTKLTRKRTATKRSGMKRRTMKRG